MRLPSAVGPAIGGKAPPKVLQPQARAAGACQVVIVDDSPDAADMLSLAFRELGCITRVASDGPSALALVAVLRPQLVLLDIGLPGMDGYQLARLLRQGPGSAKMRLVAVTGYGQRRDIELALQAGFDEHLVKPVEFEKLEEILGRSALDREGQA